MSLFSVLFDTCVVISGARPRRTAVGVRPSAELLRKWERDVLHGVASAPLLREYEDVLSRFDTGVSDEARSRALRAARDPTLTTFYELSTPPFRRVSPDPDDDHLFALIEAADPDFLCTEDVEGVLDLHVWRDTVIVSAEVLHSVVAYEQFVADAATRLR